MGALLPYFVPLSLFLLRSTSSSFVSSPFLSRKGATTTNSCRKCRALESSTTKSTNEDDGQLSLADVGIVLLAGGTGSRMKADMPKQFLSLGGKPVLHHSLELFLETLPNSDVFLDGPAMVVLVMDPRYQKLPEYQSFADRFKGKFAFANPGEERQGSVENGLNMLMDLSKRCKYVAVHDSARPLVTTDEICSVVSDAKRYGAAVLGVPCKATIKESDDGVLVKRTIPRERLWEVHTPQVIRIDTLKRGFDKVMEENWEVTDDVSIVENLGEPVKLTLGEYTNLKITTPEDMEVAEAILNERLNAKSKVAS